MSTPSQAKALWAGELGLISVLAALALLCIFVAAGTIEPAYSFHTGLAVVAAALAIFAILQRYTARPADPPPLEINGLPNYNFGPVKFATLIALFWGFAGMAVGVYIAFELAFPDLNIAPWFNFGRLAAADERSAAAGLAAEVGVPFTGLFLDAPLDKRLERIASRRSDASDADAVVAHKQTADPIRQKGWAALPAFGSLSDTTALARARLRSA